MSTPETPPLEVTLVPPSPSAATRQASISRDEWLRLAHRAKVLSWVSLGYMAFEGAVALIAGIVAGSVALIGFGIDSAIEGFASLVVVWRFTGHRLLSEHAEQQAQRLVAIQFFLLAPYITFEAVKALITGEHADASPLGIALSITSLAFMPYLGRAKQRIGERMGSVATRGEGQQNMLCAYLSVALLVGLAGNALFGLWWLDLAVGLLIGGLALKEGVEAWRGEGCCAPGALPGEVGAEACHDDCCR